jgi:hypothetical protein
MQEGSKLLSDPSEPRTALDLDRPVIGECCRAGAAGGSDVPGFRVDAIDGAHALDGNVRVVPAADAQVVHAWLAAVVVDLDGDAQLGADDRSGPLLNQACWHQHPRTWRSPR